MKTNQWIIYPLILAGLAISVAACNKSQQPIPMSSPLSTEVTDAEITMKVKAALVENETLRLSHIDVVTTNGDVKLTGLVDNQSQIDLATEITKKVQGVHAIHEHMTKP